MDANVPDFDFDYFKRIPQKSKITFIERIPIVWGGHSLVWCEQRLLEVAIEGGYAYYHLLSGADLPLKRADEIYCFFEEHKEYTFLSFNNEEFRKSREVQERVRLYHPLKNYYGRDNNLLHAVEKILRMIQRCISVDRFRNSERVIYIGSQWFSISHEMAQYICGQKRGLNFYLGIHCVLMKSLFRP